MRLPDFSSRWTSVFLLVLPALISCSGGIQPVPATVPVPAGPGWVVSWGASPETALPTSANPGGQEQSFRFLLLPTVSGVQERVHFSNLFGTTPVTIGAARLSAAAATGAAIDPTRDAQLTFNGSTTVTMQPGQEIVSDSVQLSYTFGEKMAVSIYMPGTFPPLTQHESQVTTNYATVANAGNQTTDAQGTAFTKTNTEWYLLTGMDVYGTYQGTVALFGSSSIDGHNSNFGNSNSYPTANVAVPGQDNDRPSDWLARQLNAAGYKMGVLNAGILGDAAGPAGRVAPGAGALSGIDRFAHDVLTQPGIKTAIIYLGGIDLRIDCNSATNIEGFLTQMVAQAQSAGVRVILATLPPSEYCTSSVGLVPSTANPYGGDFYEPVENPGSIQRRALNDWIRTSGAKLPGVVAVADFDKVLTDPSHPDFMIPNLNSGDNFHPNGAGYGVQSSAIPLDSILAK